MADYLVHKAIELSALSAATRSKLERNEHWIISPKYDGCHAILMFDEGKHVGTVSRTGELVRSMPHIGETLADAYSGLLSRGRYAICGEAWTDGLPFNEISGLFRRHTKSEQLGFVPFDYVPYALDTEGLPALLTDGTIYSRRLALLCNSLGGNYGLVYRPRYSFIAGSFGDALTSAQIAARFHKARTDSFFDGAVLANGNGLYSVGSGKGGEFIKVKPLLSESVVVEQLHAARGDKTGKHTLALGFTHNGVYQKVSTGLTQVEVDAYIAEPLLIFGKTIEVEAMGLTVNGAFREPRFKGIRTDA